MFLAATALAPPATAASVKTLYAVMEGITETGDYFSTLGFAPVTRAVATITYDPGATVDVFNSSGGWTRARTPYESFSIAFGANTLALSAGGVFDQPGLFQDGKTADYIEVIDHPPGSSFPRDTFRVTTQSRTIVDPILGTYSRSTRIERYADDSDGLSSADMPALEEIATLPTQYFYSVLYTGERSPEGAGRFIGSVAATSVVFTDTPPAAIPLPPSFALLPLGFAALLALGRRRKASAG